MSIEGADRCHAKCYTRRYSVVLDGTLVIWEQGVLTWQSILADAQDAGAMTQEAALEIKPETGDWKRIGEHIVACVREQDFERLGEPFHPNVIGRLLIPSGLVTPVGTDTLINYFRKWFGDADQINLEDSQVTQVVDRLHVGYRFRVHEDGHWYVVEQQMNGLLEDGKIVRFDWLCSGFLPDPATS